MIESLESRQFLSGSGDVARVFAIDTVGSIQIISIQTNLHITKTGTLAIKGTDAADSLSVIRDGAWIKYQTNNGGTIANFFTKAANVKRVLVEAGGGNDRVFVDPELNKPCTIVGGSGDDHLDGNPGATLIGGSGNDRLFAAPYTALNNLTGQIGGGIGVTQIDSPALLSGGAGNDTLIGNKDDHYAGGAGKDTALLDLAYDGATLGGNKLSDYFADSTGLEVLLAQLGTGKGTTFVGVT